MKGADSSVKQLILFCVVGAFNTAHDIALYFLLRQLLLLPIHVASPLTIFSVITLSYVLNSLFVFKHPISKTKYFEFVIITGIGVAIIQTVTSMLFEAQLYQRLVELGLVQEANSGTFIANSITRISGIAFSLTWNFLFYKFVIFRFRGKPDGAEPLLETR